MRIRDRSSTGWSHGDASRKVFHSAPGVPRDGGADLQPGLAVVPPVDGYDVLEVVALRPPLVRLG